MKPINEQHPNYIVQKAQSKMEVQRYENFPIVRKTGRVTVVGRVESDETLHGVALMMSHGEPSNESNEEMWKMAHLFKAAPQLFEALHCLKNRMETIAENHPEIALQADIDRAYDAMSFAQGDVSVEADPFTYH